MYGEDKHHIRRKTSNHLADRILALFSVPNRHLFFPTAAGFTGRFGSGGDDLYHNLYRLQGEERRDM